MRERRVICEGYHDRAFWAGLLTDHLGLRSLTSGFSPDGRKLDAGEYGFVKQDPPLLVRVAPGKPGDAVGNVWARAASLLKEGTRRAESYVITVDPDTPAGATGGPGMQRLRQMLDSVDSPRTEIDGGVRLEDTGTMIHLLRWEAPDEPSLELPTKQTLERLAFAALAEAYPERARAVARWLESRPEPKVSPGGKDWAWSFMAGWHADSGCDFFYQSLWQDSAVAAALQARLEHTGAWDVITSLVA